MRILSGIKKKFAVKARKTWNNLKPILLSERSQSENATYYLLSGKGKTTQIIKRSVVSRVSGVVREIVINM